MIASLAAALSAAFPARRHAAGRRGRAAVPFAVTLALLAGGGVVAGAQGSADKPLPPCFGAAAHDDAHPCNNSSLRYKVTPTPDDAVIEPNSECIPVSLRVQPFVCSFGAARTPSTHPEATIALVGDSHAAHWRAALDPVAKARNWAGLSLTRSSCPYSKTVPALEEKDTQHACVQWNKQVPRWFARHKEVSTVFISEHIQVRVVAPKGADQFATKVVGYMRKWRALPPTVKHVVVIKDTPRATGNTAACVTRALAAKQRAGSTCAIPAGYAVKPDPAVEAVRRLADPRYLAVDLTRFFCSPRFCQPVIGGALVYKDPGHITRIFGQSLAPYLYQAIAALAPFAVTPPPAADPAPASPPPGA